MDRPVTAGDAGDTGAALAEVILYVADQAASAAFYRALLGRAPRLDVPGMTEFDIAPGMLLGLMPEQGIARLLGDALPHPSAGSGVPRCELYLRVPDADAAYARALRAGAVPVSAPAPRDWGDTADSSGSSAPSIAGPARLGGHRCLCGGPGRARAGVRGRHGGQHRHDWHPPGGLGHDGWHSPPQPTDEDRWTRSRRKTRQQKK